MNLLSVEEIASKWGISTRSVRNYCALGRIPGAILVGKTWNIPEDSQKPDRKHRQEELPSSIADILLSEMQGRISGGLYNQVQIDLAYNSNHIEGSHLSHDQTRHIFETQTIGTLEPDMPVDDIIETANHFKCLDIVIESYMAQLNEAYIKRLHAQLKNGTTDSRKGWFAVGDYKRLPNEVGGRDTTHPKDVHKTMIDLLKDYKESKKSFEDIIDFHVRFEAIHPFQDGNGRVGRLILFKECLKHNITPISIDESLKFFYYRGITEWRHGIREYLLDTCRTGQDFFDKLMRRFGHK